MQITETPPTRYNNFKLWIERNGCKIDSRLIIAADASGSMGLKTCKELPANTAVIAVPEKLILTVQKCYECSQLNKLYQANDDLFDYEDSDDAEFNVLAVFVMYEKGKILKGQRSHPEEDFHSFWQPYLESVDQPETAMDWTEEELSGMPQDFLEEVEHFRKEIERMEQRVVAFLEKRPQFTGLSRQDLNNLFNYGYKFIMTRCFGYSTPGTSLIPLADLMNHNCEAVDHQLINTEREQVEQVTTNEYTKHCEKIDIGQLLIISSLGKPQPNYSPVSQYISQYSSLSTEEAEKLTRQQRRQKVLQINLSQRPASVDSLSLNYFSSSDEEDNDTESDEEEMREQEMEFLRQQEKEQMEVFKDNYSRIRILQLHDVEEQLNKIEAQEEFIEGIEKKMHEANQDKPKVVVEQTTVGSVITSSIQAESGQLAEFKSQKEQSTAQKSPGCSRQNYFVEQANAHKTMQEQLKEANKFKQFQDMDFLEGNDKESSESSESEEEEFKWFQQPGTYFLISTGRPVGEGRQLYNCYGRRTNRFLLIWYGFCYSDNLFDSIAFRFHVDFALEKRVNNLVFGHYYGGKGLIKGFPKENGIIKSNQVSRQFRLKRSRLCEGLLVFLRLFLMNQYKGDDLGKLFATLPSSLEFQIFVLSFMEQLVLELSKKYVHGWKKEWSESTNYRQKFKATFFSEQTKIIETNIGMIHEARGMLVELMNDPRMTVRGLLEGRKRDPEVVRKLRKYLLSVQENLEYIRLNNPPAPVCE